MAVNVLKYTTDTCTCADLFWGGKGNVINLPLSITPLTATITQQLSHKAQTFVQVPLFIGLTIFLSTVKFLVTKFR